MKESILNVKRCDIVYTCIVRPVITAARTHDSVIFHYYLLIASVST